MSSPRFLAASSRQRYRLGEDFLAAIDSTIKVLQRWRHRGRHHRQVDRDEVLLDIGYKTEGVIPSRELSIKHDVDPSEVVNVGDEVEALVLTKEDKRPPDPVQEARSSTRRAWAPSRSSRRRTRPSRAPSSRSSRAA